MSLDVLIHAIGAADTYLKKKILQETTCDPSCKNGGVCLLNECDCRRTGHEGILCELPVCRKPCENGGICLGYDVCQCPAYFFGRNCDIELVKYGGIFAAIGVVAITLLYILLARRRGREYYVRAVFPETANVQASIDDIDDVAEHVPRSPSSMPAVSDEDDEITRIKKSIHKYNNTLSINNSDQDWEAGPEYDDGYIFSDEEGVGEDDGSNSGETPNGEITKEIESSITPQYQAKAPSDEEEEEEEEEDDPTNSETSVESHEEAIIEGNGAQNDDELFVGPFGTNKVPIHSDDVSYGWEKVDVVEGNEILDFTNIAHDTAEHTVSDDDVVLTNNVQHNDGEGIIHDDVHGSSEDYTL